MPKAPMPKAAAAGVLSVDAALGLASARAAATGGALACPFAACDRRFRSSGLLATHVAAHGASRKRTAPPAARPPQAAPCGAPAGFDDVFLDAPPARRRRSPRVERGAGGRGAEGAGGADEGEDDDDESEEGEDVGAAEIAGNAAYLNTQLRAARSRRIHDWSSADYENALRWALWVKENVDECRDKAALADELGKKKLSLAAVDDAEFLFFDAVFSHEVISEEMLGHLSSAAGNADRVDETPGRNLSALADCIAAAVVRRHTVDRLTSVASRLDRATGASGECTQSEVAKKASLKATAARSTDAGRAQIFLRAFASLAPRDLGRRLDAFFSKGGPADIRMACDVLVLAASAASGSNGAGFGTVQSALRDRLLGLSKERVNGELWKLDKMLLCQLGEADFPMFRGYMLHLLARLKCFLWNYLRQDIGLLEAAMKAKGISRPSGQDNMALLRTQSAAECRDAVALVGSGGGSGSAWLSEREDLHDRFSVLLSRCGNVGVITRLFLTNFVEGLAANLRSIYLRAFSALKIQLPFEEGHESNKSERV